MSEDEGLEPDVLAILRTATPTSLPAGAAARVLANLESRVGPISGGGQGSGGGQAPRPPSPARAFVSAHPLLALGTALVLGGALGALARGAATPSVVYIDRPTPVSAPAPAPEPAPAPAPEPEPEPEPEPAPAAVPEPAPEPAPAAVPARPPAAVATALDSAASLAAESALLDVARTALARGEADHALAATARHAAQFPNGALREEREALTVKALALAGRDSEARAKADRFRARYPGSVFGGAIDASLKSPDASAP
jgi:hypothetical protein